MIALKVAFAAWCAANGYQRVRRVDCLSEIGEASISIRKRGVTITVATRLGPEQGVCIRSGQKHGYDYQLLNAEPGAALAFMGAA